MILDCSIDLKGSMNPRARNSLTWQCSQNCMSRFTNLTRQMMVNKSEESLKQNV